MVILAFRAGEFNGGTADVDSAAKIIVADQQTGHHRNSEHRYALNRAHHAQSWLN
jgi:hypothetical protein